MLSLRSLVAALMLATGALGSVGRAQTSNDDSAESPLAGPAVIAAARAPSDDAATVGPDIFLLPDKEGRLRRLLGYQYEDFFNAWQIGRAADEPAQKPVHSLASVEVDATTNGDVADVAVRIEVALHADGWVRAPLRFGSLVLADSRIEGSSEQEFLTFDSEQRGYIFWANGTAGQVRTVSLEGRVPIRRNADEHRLELELPVSSRSRINLETPEEVEIESESAVVAAATSDGERTQSRIDGAKGPVALTWKANLPTQAPRAAGFEATSNVLVSVEQGRLTYDAVISLADLRDPIERLKIKLPANVALQPDAGAGYSVLPIGEATGDRVSGVEVTFEHPTTTPPDVRLTAVQSAVDAQSTAREIGVFEVLGAFRQQGAVAIRVGNDVHAHFEQSGRVRQIEPADLPPALSTEPALAAFETFGADWLIEVHTQPRKRQVTVTPDYELHLGSQGALLEVVLDYHVSGGPLFDLRLNLRGWELSEQPIESGGVINLAEQHVSDDTLILPLNDSDVQQAQIRFNLRREAGLGLHDLPLLEAEGASVLPGDLTVTCDPSWRATAQIEKSVGVSPIDLRLETPPAPASSDATTELRPVPLRLQTFLPQARLVVDVSEREQLIRVASAVNAEIVDQSVRGEQVLEYEILYQPATQITATVSGELLANEGLQLLLDGKPLSSSAVDVQPLPDTLTDRTGGNLRLVVKLPNPTIGQVRLSIRSHLSIDKDQRARGVPVTLPLAMPDHAARSRAFITSAEPSLRVALANNGNTGDWTPAASANANGAPTGAPPSSAGLQMIAAKPVSQLAFRLVPTTSGPSVETRIEAAWVQTWIAGGMRQDRLVYRFHTTGRRIEIRIPQQYEQVEAMLDGAIVSVDRTNGETISVGVPAGQSERPHTLELRRHTPLRIGSWGKQSVAFPQIVGANAWSPFLWQLILPADLSALATPDGMSAEYRLGWHGVRWGREPTQSQRDLEHWTSATTAPTPGPRTNQYVFSAFEPPETVEFVAVRRIWLVIAAGLGVFAIGLAWLYTSVARSAAFWLGLCVAIGGLLFVYPEAVILVVQAVILGGAFTLISAVTQWLLSSSGMAPSPRKVSASSDGSQTATQSWPTEAPVEAALSTPSGSTFQPSGSAS